MKDFLFVVLQYFLPHHLISRLAGAVANARMDLIRLPLIRWFIRHYQVDLEESEITDYHRFEHFNAFFTRALAQGARPINEDAGAMVSPVDGTISQIGDIEQGRIFQAKGMDFSTLELLGGDQQLADVFQNGRFTTIYLSPRDYHRIHMPVSGVLTDMVYVPGRLFSVNPATTSQVPRLFARNERVVCVFNTEHGRMAMVLVGAMIVASVETVWAGEVAPVRPRIQHQRYADQEPTSLARGQEMGRFKLGSTVVLLHEDRSMEWLEDKIAGTPVRLGEKIASR
jgi:phosphatidylserine decarboxylase